MYRWSVIGRRLTVRRVLALSVIVFTLVLTFTHILNLMSLPNDLESSQNKDSSLPALNDETNTAKNPNIDVPAPQSPSDKNDNDNDQDELQNTQKTIKEYVFHLSNNNTMANGQSYFQQDVGFEDMQPFEVHNFKFNDRDAGRAMIGRFDSPQDQPLHEKYDPSYQRENATFFSLVRNEDFQGMIEAIESVEARFNFKYHYDWVFANDQPFHPSFIRVVSQLVSGKAHFVNIPQKYWDYPPWIDQHRAELTREDMRERKVKYGASESYRHMCRFNAGLFYLLPVMQQYRYYWRVEPDIRFHCDIFETDWFNFMRLNNKKYAFTLSPLELHTTVVGLWDAVTQFKKKNKRLVAKDNNMDFLTEDGGVTYNMCHFWSNFEIGDMDFYRSESYSQFFDHIDKAGGIYYSRWGDAPIHSMAVSLLLSKDELLFLQNTGYYHKPNGDCPHDPEVKRKRRCACLVDKDFTWDKGSCIPKWFEIHGFEKPQHAPQYKFVNQHHPAEEKEEELPELDEEE